MMNKRRVSIEEAKALVHSFVVRDDSPVVEISTLEPKVARLMAQRQQDWEVQLKHRRPVLK